MKRPTSSRLILEGNRRGSIACRKLGKSANCQAATEPKGRKIDIRMKPDWLNDSQAALTVAKAEDSYIRLIAVPYATSRDGMARTYCDATAISGEKDESRIRQSIKFVNTMTKWGLPKLGCLKAMSADSEYPIWQRSSRSSLSVGKPRTWQRGAVRYFNN